VPQDEGSSHSPQSPPPQLEEETETRTEKSPKTPTSPEFEFTATELLPEPEPYKPFPSKRNVSKGLALQWRRPDVAQALGLTVSHKARPPASFYELLAPEVTESALEGEAHTSQELAPKPTFAMADNEALILQDSAVSVASTATPETSTAPETPQPGSPHSSMTSVSVLPKSPSIPVSGLSVSQPSQNEEVEKFVEEPSDKETVVATPPGPSEPAGPPVKKSWASLLKPGSTSSPGSR